MDRHMFRHSLGLLNISTNISTDFPLPPIRDCQPEMTIRNRRNKRDICLALTSMYHTDKAACSQHLTGFPRLTSLESVAVTLCHPEPAPVRICNSCNIMCMWAGGVNGMEGRPSWQYHCCCSWSCSWCGWGSTGQTGSTGQSSSIIQC